MFQKPMRIDSHQAPNNYYLLKYIVAGPSGVGKSCLISRLVGDEFDCSDNTTIGANFELKRFAIKKYNSAQDSINIKAHIWDTAGKEEFDVITKFYYTGANCILLAFALDIPVEQQETRLNSIIRNLSEMCFVDVPIVLVGCKYDKISDQNKANAIARSLLNQCRQEHMGLNFIGYCLTSAKTGKNVETVFTTLAEAVHQKMLSASFRSQVEKLIVSRNLSEYQATIDNLIGNLPSQSAIAALSSELQFRIISQCHLNVLIYLFEKLKPEDRVALANWRDEQTGTTALHHLVNQDDKRGVIELLVMVGARIQHDKHGRSPLHIAASNRNVAYIDALTTIKPEQQQEVDRLEEKVMGATKKETSTQLSPLVLQEEKQSNTALHCVIGDEKTEHPPISRESWAQVIYQLRDCLSVKNQYGQLPIELATDSEKQTILGAIFLTRLKLKQREELVKIWSELNDDEKHYLHQKALFYAVSTPDYSVEEFKWLTQTELFGFDKTIQDKDGATILLHTKAAGNAALFDYLHDECHMSFDKVKALNWAAYKGHFNLVMELLKDTELYRLTYDNCKNPLHYAAEGGHLDIVKYLLARDLVSCNATDKQAKTPLHYAAEGGHLDVVEHLAQQGSGRQVLYGSGSEGILALDLAAEGGHLDVVKYLVKRCLSIQRSTQWHDPISLHKAARGGHLNVVKYLLEEAGTSPKVTDRYGKTALHHAAEGGRLNVITHLLAKGLSPKAKDIHGNNVLHIAAEYGHLNIVQYFVEQAKMSLDVTNNQGCNALFVAINSGKLETALYLAERQFEVLLEKKNFIKASTWFKTMLSSQDVKGHADIFNALKELYKEKVKRAIERYAKTDNQDSQELQHALNEYTELTSRADAVFLQDRYSKKSNFLPDEDFEEVELMKITSDQPRQRVVAGFAFNGRFFASKSSRPKTSEDQTTKKHRVS